MIGSEEFDFGIERFCKRIGGTVIVEVQYLVIMFIEGSCDDVNECSPASSTLLYQRAIDRRAASLIVFLEKIILREWHRPYAVFMSGYSSKSIAARCFCLSVHLSADMKSR